MTMHLLSRRVWGILAMLAVVGTSLAWAEVAVRVDRLGNYVSTLVIPVGDEQDPRVWTPRSQRLLRRSQTLNPDGDFYGDGWPLVCEEPTAARHPWVVWSRAAGADIDLVYSKWEGAAWAPVRQLHPQTPAGDDLDPSIAFDCEARPYLTWWSSEGDKGKVYVSVRLTSGWMAPFLISDVEVDSRHPLIEMQRSTTSGGTAEIVYETPTGLVRQEVAFTLPVTITDDINPMGVVHAGNPVEVGERSSND